jgi:hypothetical protein
MSAFWRYLTSLIGGEVTRLGFARLASGKVWDVLTRGASRNGDGNRASAN